jgi:hypothetical protein
MVYNRSDGVKRRGLFWRTFVERFRGQGTGPSQASGEVLIRWMFRVFFTIIIDKVVLSSR